MIYPTLETFQENQLKFKSVPVFIQFKEDYFTPIAIFEKLQQLNPTYILESAGEHQENGRYSYIGLYSEFYNTDHMSLDELESNIKNNKSMKIDILPPFYDGYIGYMGYESIKELHQVDIKKVSSIANYSILFSKVTVIIDHFINEITIVYNAKNDDDYDTALTVVSKIRELIQEENIIKKASKLPGHLKLKSNMTKMYYHGMVKKAQDYIRAGDIFQVVLSQKFSAPFDGDAFEVYKSVRRENPSPYLSYIRFEEVTIICSSPELLIKHTNGLIQTSPIAGTRAVKNDGKDDRRANELLNDEKELAEHLMLVDLGRNDIGKVARPGSVSVDSYCQVKKYAKVMHLVSSVKGQLKENETSISALISAFPAGTVSGAPKKRAMEIIDELEPDSRELYAGSIFYINNDGNLNSCIAIRTIMIKDSILTIQAGGGIVIDSNADDEYLETLNKASALFKALEHLYQGGISYDFDYR